MGESWVLASIGIRGNDATDRVTKYANKFLKISLNIHPPAFNLALSFRRLIFKNWSLSWRNQIYEYNSELLEIKKEFLP